MKKKPLHTKPPYPACEYLPFNIKQNMKEETIRSKKDGLEHGFVICSSAEYWGQMNEQNTVPSEKCTGTECKITVTRENVQKSCPEDKRDIAYFHTHPKRDISLPSFDDIISIHALGHKFSCIGSKKEIRCFSQNVPAPKAFMEIPSKDYERFKKQWEEHAEDCTINL